MFHHRLQKTILFSLALASSCLPSTFVKAQANVTGNCLSGLYRFDPLRVFAVSPGGAPGSVHNPTINVSTYDFTIDYGSQGVKKYPNGTIEVALTKSKTPNVTTAVGARISSLRYFLYGKISARMRAVNVPGVVTTFITMSDVHDEIDFEFVGHKNRSVETNVFYKGIQEYVVHSRTHNLPNNATTINDYVTYTIDWTNTTIIFSIDDRVVRTIYRNSSESQSPFTPKGEFWFPNTPSLIQVSVWDGGSSSSPGTSSWAGGMIPWGDRSSLSAAYDWINVTCYNDRMQPVEKWPLDSPSRMEAPASQPTSAADANKSVDPNGRGNSSGFSILNGADRAIETTAHRFIALFITLVGFLLCGFSFA